MCEAPRADASRVGATRRCVCPDDWLSGDWAAHSHNRNDCAIGGGAEGVSRLARVWNGGASSRECREDLRDFGRPLASEPRGEGHDQGSPRTTWRTESLCIRQDRKRRSVRNRCDRVFGQGARCVRRLAGVRHGATGCCVTATGTASDAYETAVVG